MGGQLTNSTAPQFKKNKKLLGSSGVDLLCICCTRNHFCGFPTYFWSKIPLLDILVVFLKERGNFEAKPIPETCYMHQKHISKYFIEIIFTKGSIFEDLPRGDTLR